MLKRNNSTDRINNFLQMSHIKAQENLKWSDSQKTEIFARYNLTLQDVLGKNDSKFKLDKDEILEISNNNELFKAWVKHVYQHKQMKALKIGPYKQPDEEYNINHQFDIIPRQDRLKLAKYIIIRFKKFFAGNKPIKEPCSLFLDIWIDILAELKMNQIINAAANLINTANSQPSQYNRLKEISENAEKFRMFCIKY